MEKYTGLESKINLCIFAKIENKKINLSAFLISIISVDSTRQVL